VAAGLRCQRCGPAHLAIGGQGEGATTTNAASSSSILPEWTGALGGTNKTDEEEKEEPHPCDAVKAALAALRTDPQRRAQTVVTMGSAAGVVDASTHLVLAVLAHYEAGAGALTGRVATALELLRTLLVLDDAALLSSPMELRFAVRMGEGKQGEEETLVGAALDLFLIERDPAKYDSLRYVHRFIWVCMDLSD
jgi:hypothetical protein